jgi:hypothetical protein
MSGFHVNYFCGLHLPCLRTVSAPPGEGVRERCKCIHVELTEVRDGCRILDRVVLVLVGGVCWFWQVLHERTGHTCSLL